MTALADSRDTDKMGVSPLPSTFSVPMAAAKIYKGALVVLNSAGFAVGGTTATTHVATVGRAAETVDNSAGSAGDLNITVEAGVFKYGNSATTDEITKVQTGAVCYVVDDQTVAKTNGSSSRSVAGTVIKVDASTDDGGAGVWVLCAPWDKRA